MVVVGKGNGWVMRARIGGWGDGMEHDAWRWVGLGLRGRGTGMGIYGIMIMRASYTLLRFQEYCTVSSLSSNFPLKR